MNQREYNPIIVATVLCVVCSLAVSVAAVSLKGKQDSNVALDIKKNILDDSGLSTGEYGRPAKELTMEEIENLYQRVSGKVVDLETGEYDTTFKTEEDIQKFDARKSVTKDGVQIVDPQFNPGLDKRPRKQKVYFVKKSPDDDKIQQVVLPINGQGLWSTLYGYIAIKSDLKTIQGLSFYEHAETPGLGGEVDNQKWKESWEGRMLFDPEGTPAAQVFKGTAPSDNPYAVDGLSGATITSAGVQNLIRYWASDDGFGPFLAKLKQEIN